MLRKNLLSALILLGVAAAAYTAGAAGKGKAAVMLSDADLKWEDAGPGSPFKVALLWGDMKAEHAILFKMPAGAEAGNHSHTNDYHAVLVQGSWVHAVEGGAESKEMGPGSYVMQPGKQVHNDFCKGTEDCIVMIHQHGKGDMIPAKTAAAPAK